MVVVIWPALLVAAGQAVVEMVAATALRILGLQTRVVAVVVGRIHLAPQQRQVMEGQA